MARFLSPSQNTLLTAILDRLIPATSTMPGAGQVGASDYLDGIVGGSPGLARTFSEGLRSVETHAASRGATFLAMSDEQRDEILRDIEANESVFFDTLLMHTFNGYYSNPRVVAALGLEPRPPQPRGHVVEYGDFSSLEAVQSRGQAYRDA